jgi:hypothetical protein
MFKDASGVDYMLVANRDYRQPQSVVVRLQSKWLGIAPWQKPKRYKYAVVRRPGLRDRNNRRNSGIGWPEEDPAPYPAAYPAG